MTIIHWSFLSRFVISISNRKDEKINRWKMDGTQTSHSKTPYVYWSSELKSGNMPVTYDIQSAHCTIVCSHCFPPGTNKTEINQNHNNQENWSRFDTVFRVIQCAGFCPDSLICRRGAHYKQEQCVSLFPRPGNHMSANKTQHI